MDRAVLASLDHVTMGVTSSGEGPFSFQKFLQRLPEGRDLGISLQMMVLPAEDRLRSLRQAGLGAAVSASLAYKRLTSLQLEMSLIPAFAEGLLSILPSSVTSLKLVTDSSIVTSDHWTRCWHLHRLALTRSSVSEGICSASKLASLTALSSLILVGSHIFEPGTLQLPSLQNMQLVACPLPGPLHVSTSQLTHLSIEDGPLPAWAASLPSISMSQWTAFDTSTLPFSAFSVKSLTLNIHASCLLPVTQLLAMQHLEHLKIMQNGLYSIVFKGRMREYLQLAKTVNLVLPHVGVELVHDHHGWEVSTPVADNGHVIGCLCQHCST